MRATRGRAARRAPRITTDSRRASSAKPRRRAAVMARVTEAAIARAMRAIKMRAAVNARRALPDIRTANEEDVASADRDTDRSRDLRRGVSIRPAAEASRDASDRGCCAGFHEYRGRA